MTASRRIASALALPPFDVERESIYDFRRVGFVPAWVQVIIVTGLFVATVLLTNAEYRAHGTVFGYPGPAFNVLFAPIYEELIFRGWIIARLIRKHSKLLAIVVSSLLFGLLHIRNIYWKEPAALAQNMACTGLVLGPVFAYVTLRTRSVWPAVMLHYANNLTFYL